MDVSATQETIYVDNRLEYSVKGRPILPNISTSLDRYDSYLNESRDRTNLVDFPDDYEVIILLFDHDHSIPNLLTG